MQSDYTIVVVRTMSLGWPELKSLFDSYGETSQIEYVRVNYT
jgi:hypothetical protein